MLNFSFSSRSLSREYTFLFLFSKVENIFSDFSFSSRNWGKEIHISLSPLEIGEINFIFLFLLSKLEKLVSDFSFSSRKWRNWFQISLSPLDWTFLPLVNLWSERGSRAYLARGNNTWFTVQMFCKMFCANILVNIRQNVLVNVEASSSCCGAGNGFLSVIGIALCFSAVTLPLQELFLPGLFL